MRRRIGSIRELRAGVYRVELTHGRDPVSGDRRRMSKTMQGTETDAERALAKMLLDIGQLTSGAQLTVADYLQDMYLPRLDARVRRQTARGYRSKLELHVIPQLGHLKLGELEPFTLDKWRDELDTKMGRTSVQNVFRTLSVALNRAVKWRLIKSNPLRAVDTPRRQSRNIVTLSTDEALAYLQAFAGHRIEPVVVIALEGGLRPCELSALTWSDIDIHTGEVTVRRGLHERDGETWFELPKSERSHRVVVLSQWAVDVLKPLRGIGPLVPGDGIDGHAKPSSIARAYRNTVRAAKLRYLPLRDLRHTHATLMLEAGVELAIVSRRLGHSGIAITDQFYLRPKLSADQAAAAAFSELLATSRDKSRQATSGDNMVQRDG